MDNLDKFKGSAITRNFITILIYTFENLNY